MRYGYHNPIQIAILMWGGIFCLLAAVCIGFGKNFEREKQICMVLMQISTAILLGSDAIAWIFRGADSQIGYHMVRIGHFLVFSFSDIILLLFHAYVCRKLLEKKERQDLTRVKVGYVIGLLALFLVVVSQFTHWYYSFDSWNYYHRGQFYIVSLGLPLIGMGIDASLLLKYGKRVSREMFTAMASYIVLPIAGGIYQVFYYGTPLINVCTGISMIIMFMMTMIEQGKELEILAINQAKTEEQLEIATTLNQCVAELSSNADVDVAINNLLEVIRIYFQADRTYIFENDYRRNITVNTHEQVKDQVSVEIDNLQGVPLEVISKWMEQFKQGMPYYIPDIEREKATPVYEILKEQDVERLLAVPLLDGGKVMGFLGVDNPRKHYADATLLSSLQFFVCNSLKTKKQQEKLRYLSYRDMLTQLYNRNKYMRLLEKYRDKTMENVGIAYLDLNGLKKINDEYGHGEGDRFICKAAQAIWNVFGEYAYRIGGDEFVVVAFPMEQQEFEESIERLKRELQRREISSSIGVIWSSVVDDLEEVLKTADYSMYQMKKEYHRQENKMKDSE